MKFSYLLMEREYVLIYWIINILQSLISLVQSQIRQSIINFQHSLNNICGSFILMENILSHLKVRLMNSIAIRLKVENPRSISVNTEGRATI